MDAGNAGVQVADDGKALDGKEYRDADQGREQRVADGPMPDGGGGADDAVEIERPEQAEVDFDEPEHLDEVQPEGSREPGKDERQQAEDQHPSHRFLPHQVGAEDLLEGDQVPVVECFEFVQGVRDAECVGILHAKGSAVVLFKASVRFRCGFVHGVHSLGACRNGRGRTLKNAGFWTGNFRSCY